MRASRTSSFTVIKGSLIPETYAAFQTWDLSSTQSENLNRLRADNRIGARSANWLRDVAWVLSRRFDTDGPDRPLVRLARAGCALEVWRPILLWHMTRDELLVRDFVSNWLYGRYVEGHYLIRVSDVVPYVASLPSRGATSKEGWTDATISRVASGLLRLATDFGLMRGAQAKEFASYHLPDESLLYILYALAEHEANATQIVNGSDWRLYLMGPDDVERELLRLHQFRRLHYAVAGSLAQLSLPCGSLAEYVEGMVAQ